MEMQVLRVIDALLALFWLGVLIHALRTGFIGPRGVHLQTRRTRPVLFWFMIFIYGLMVIHFGGLAIGIFAELIARRFEGSPELRLFIVTGILGGFTTFSAFSLEVTAMAEGGDYVIALAYVLISVIISVAAVFAGLALVRGLI